ncbi:MAG TPA: transposase [Armatimonadota bacterium]|nr:transposase [Armatimonadota bacterium]
MILWRSRGYLPHFDGEHTTQMVTFHLADCLPTALLRRWRDELQYLPVLEAERERRCRIEEYLDRGHGNTWLRDPRIAELAETALLFFDRKRYNIHAWVIMPTHAHTLFTPFPPDSLSTILHSWKTYTAREANKILAHTGAFWYREYYDRFIRNEEHFARAKRYIESNPISAGLCTRPEDWPWSSASWPLRHR